MSKYIEVEKLIAEIEKRIKEVKEAAVRFSLNMGFFDAKLSGIYDVVAIVDSLQQEQPESELEKTVEFECIGKKMKLTVQELINYYIDSECVDVADECGF